MSERFHDINLEVNGEEVSERVDARTTLVDFLREQEAAAYDDTINAYGTGAAHTVLAADMAARER